MKLIAHSPIAAVLAAVVLATTAARGADEKANEKPAQAPANNLPANVTGALEKAGVDAKTIEQIQGAISGAGGASVRTIMIGPDGKVVSESEGAKVPADPAKPATGKEKKAKSSAVSVRTTVVGPDGKVVTQSGGQTMTLDLGKVIAEATAAALAASDSNAEAGAAGEAKTSISGKVMIVGADGKVTTQSLGDAADSAALQKALGAALGGIDVRVLQAGDSKVQTHVFGFGDARIEGGDASERLTNIEKELKSQRELLEQILKKL